MQCVRQRLQQKISTLQQIEAPISYYRFPFFHAAFTVQWVSYVVWWEAIAAGNCRYKRRSHITPLLIVMAKSSLLACIATTASIEHISQAAKCAAILMYFDGSKVQMITLGACTVFSTASEVLSQLGRKHVRLLCFQRRLGF